MSTRQRAAENSSIGNVLNPCFVRITRIRERTIRAHHTTIDVEGEEGHYPVPFAGGEFFGTHEPWRATVIMFVGRDVKQYKLLDKNNIVHTFTRRTMCV